MPPSTLPPLGLPGTPTQGWETQDLTLLRTPTPKSGQGSPTGAMPVQGLRLQRAREGCRAQPGAGARPGAGRAQRALQPSLRGFPEAGLTHSPATG